MSPNLPNQITVARIGLSVVFFVMLSLYSQRTPQTMLLDIATVIFIIAALSDFVDGYLARTYQCVTPLGRILDPVADKVLICGAFTILAGANFVDEHGINVTGVAPWMVVLIVTREMLVTAVRAYNESAGYSFGAAWHGKLKMWAQSIACPVILVLVAHGDQMFSPATANTIKLVTIWTTVVITIVSMADYLLRSKHILYPHQPSAKQ